MEQTALGFPVVGLTGGIASGKSTVSRMFRELSVVVLDADEIAREIVEPGEPACGEIREAFGDGVFLPNGQLHREALSRVIFADPSARSQLGAITHPRIGQRMMRRARQAHEAGAAWVIYDAALIVENGIHCMLDALIVVAIEPRTQLARLMARDGIGEAEARARIAAQMPLEQKLAVADHVIDNGGTLEETRAQVERLRGELAARFEGGGGGEGDGGR